MYFVLNGTEQQLYYFDNQKVTNYVDFFYYGLPGLPYHVVLYHNVTM